jgi:hypothetical protein
LATSAPEVKGQAITGIDLLELSSSPPSSSPEDASLAHL